MDSANCLSPPMVFISKLSSPLSNLSSTDSMSRLSLTEQCLSASTVSSTDAVSELNSDQDHKPQESLLEYLERHPVLPPSYSSAHQEGTAIRFPVFEQEETYVLPEYTPTIFKLALVLRKVEWLSPYEASPSRSWKNVVMELNSTQVNFYSIEDLPLLNRVKKSKSKKNYSFNDIEREFIMINLANDPEKYLTPNNLIRSYSLQHAKFGIPIDYKKKNYCLRLRLETEQMIVQFSCLDEMINWANFLSTGINVSLDLDSREIPNDRTVPRRRRHMRRSNRNRSYSDSELIRRELGAPVVNTRSFTRRASSGEQFIKSKISRIFGRKRSNSERSSDLIANKKQPTKEEHISQLQQAIQRNSYQHSIETEDLINDLNDIDLNDMPQVGDISTIREQEEEELEEELTENLRDEDDEDDEDEIPDNEIHSIHQLHDDSDDDSIHNSSNIDTILSHPMFNDFSFSSAYNTQEDCYLDEDMKWIPDKKRISRRKYLKDSLRCIKLLPNDECWIGKSVVRTTSPPPFRTCNEFTRKNLKNKFVKEYIIGPHGFLTVQGQ